MAVWGTGQMLQRFSIASRILDQSNTHAFYGQADTGQMWRMSQSGQPDPGDI
jgi:hypothetical protein